MDAKLFTQMLQDKNLADLNKRAARGFLTPLLRVYYIIWGVCFRCHSSV